MKCGLQWKILCCQPTACKCRVTGFGQLLVALHSNAIYRKLVTAPFPTILNTFCVKFSQLKYGWETHSWSLWFGVFSICLFNVLGSSSHDKSGQDEVICSFSWLRINWFIKHPQGEIKSKTIGHVDYSYRTGVNLYSILHTRKRVYFIMWSI